MNTKFDHVRVKDGKRFVKVRRWNYAKGSTTPGALYEGFVFYSLGNLNAMASKKKGEWMTEEEYQASKKVVASETQER